MTRVKKQHIVPLAYLKRFTYDGSRLFVLDVEQNTAFVCNAKDVAQERSFYDFPSAIYEKKFPGHRFDLQGIEKSMGFVERQLPKTIDDVLLLEQGAKLSKEQRSEMSTLLIFQITRTPMFREILMQNPQENLQFLLDLLLKGGHFKLPDGFSSQAHFEEGMEAILHGLVIINPEFVSRVVPTIFRHYWVLGVNNTSTPMLTSDSPVVVCSKEDNRAGTIWEDDLAFPLDPQHILILNQGRLNAEEWPEDGEVKQLSEDDVRCYNDLQIQNCYRQVFSQQKFLLSQ